ncbi:putative flavoprotein involved in K+ transport [Frankia canadensis]|uniref:Putative flavoprotein involved in K+ transport n=1 Tax=Frankia canadensis TaxID=1836972 RepID=A0A2I2KPJ7_9ACTN|nr:NAD(P)/FAD-dependent oxidoreductase [Frankia canadensis]SNQ47591.1 putative flavoprotein involved in K+ transport [Frankia canadensis]SOU54881.1 putative flavoprotein involved in K+ transport [Frankia canadensis]
MSVTTRPAPPAGRPSPDQVVDLWLARFAAAMTTPAAPGLRDLIAPNGWWRDFVGLDWQLASYHTPEAITRFVARAPQFPFLSVRRTDGVGDIHVDTGEASWVECFLTWTTATGEGSAHVRLVRQPDGEYRAWTVLTSLDSLRDRPPATRHRRPRPSRDGALAPWHLRHAARSAFDRPDPQVLVVGAGGSGLAVGAHLEAMGIDTLLVERNDRIGDNWRSRYEALVLHSPVHSDHLPFMPFPSTWPVYPPKAKYADWLEAFGRAMDLGVWTGSEVVHARLDQAAGMWTVRVITPEGERVLRPEQLVVATGFSGHPVTPDVPGLDRFPGTTMHSHHYRSAAGMAGRRAVVVGAGTSAHDIAEDLCHAGADVTMIQRTGTYVMSRENGNSILYEPQFHEDALPLEYTDLRALSFPWPLAMQLAPAQTARIAELDRDLLDGLRAAGFALVMGDPDIGPQGGLFSLGIRPGGAGGYYVDAGASQLIIDGRIRVHSGAGLVGYSETGVLLSDGAEYPADLVVLATGYVSLREGSRFYLGDEIVDQTDSLGGLDHRNERGLQWQPSGFPQLWYTGGGLIEVRPYSKYVALQVAADIDGTNGRKAEAR